jgi:hypothetical protein
MSRLGSGSDVSAAFDQARFAPMGGFRETLYGQNSPHVCMLCAYTFEATL